MNYLLAAVSVTEGSSPEVRMRLGNGATLVDFWVGLLPMICFVAFATLVGAPIILVVPLWAAVGSVGWLWWRPLLIVTEHTLVIRNRFSSRTIEWPEVDVVLELPGSRPSIWRDGPAGTVLVDGERVPVAALRAGNKSLFLHMQLDGLESTLAQQFPDLETRTVPQHTGWRITDR